MGRNLSTLFINQSYQFLTQISGSELQDGLGNTITGSLAITSSQAVSASFVTSASFASTATSASFATSASHAVQSETVFTTQTNANVDHFVAFVAATNAYEGLETDNQLVYNPNTNLLTVTASLANNATSASFASTATSASFATTASFALNAGTTVSTASLLTTASAVANIITFTKGDGSTFPITVATGSATSASFATTASLALNNVLTASSNNDTITFTKGDGTTFTNVINNVSASISSSFATNATSASFASTATSASYATFASSSEHADFADFAFASTSASNAATASFAETIASGLSPTFLNATASNVLITGTASVNVLITNFVSSSVIFSSGSNLLGDSATLDTQTLIGVITASGSLQVSGSADFANGITGSLLGTASFADNATSASFASTANTASYVLNAVSASFATNATSASFANTSTSSSFSTTATSASYADTSVSSSYAINASTASYTPNAVVTASISTNTITFTKGDGTTFPITVNTGSGAAAFPYTGSAEITGSLGVTGSINTGGSGNSVTGVDSGIIGGSSNTVAFNEAVVAGGNTNSAGYRAFVGGGFNNNAAGSGGTGNAIIGGEGNKVSFGGNYSYNAIIGAQSSTVNNDWGVIFGGNLNTAGFRATIIGGNANNASNWGNILGGTSNSNSSVYGVIAGGESNSATGDVNSVFGGRNNTVTAGGTDSAIVSGRYNTVSHVRSVVIGGQSISSNAADTVFVPNLNVSGSLVGNVTSSLVRNTADTYTSSAAVQQVVTLTQAEYNAIGSPDANTLYVISGSIPFNSAAFATTGSNTFVGNQIISGSLDVQSGITGSLFGIASTASFFDLSAVTQNAVFSGSVRGDVSALSISSQTASLDCSTGNFFTLLLVSGSDTFVNPSNILPGQTINLLVKQASIASGSVTFAPSVKQVGSAFTPTGTANAEDIVTLISFDSTNLYLSSVKNFV